MAYSLRQAPVPTIYLLESISENSGSKVDRLVATGFDVNASEHDRRVQVQNLKAALAEYEDASKKLITRQLGEGMKARADQTTCERRKRRTDVHDQVTLLKGASPELDDVSSVGLSSEVSERVQDFIDALEIPTSYHLPAKEPRPFFTTVDTQGQAVPKTTSWTSLAEQIRASPVETGSALPMSGNFPFVNKELAGLVETLESPPGKRNYFSLVDRGGAGESYPGRGNNFPPSDREKKTQTKPSIALPKKSEIHFAGCEAKDEQGSCSRAREPQLYDQQLVNELNRLSISPFDGRPCTFWSWKGRIMQKMTSTRLSPLYQMLLLQENTKGEPRQLVEEHLLSTGEVFREDVVEVLSLLQERYGSPDKISGELLERIDKFPYIRGKDIGPKLQKLYDLCKILAFNMRNIQQLRILDTAMGLRLVRVKLPEELQEKWREYGQVYKMSHAGNHPPFSNFCTFLREMANQRADGEFAICTDSFSQHLRGERVMKTEHAVPVQLRHHSPTGARVQCQLHNTSGHSLAECQSFLKLTQRERKDRVNRWHLCFVCLEAGHGVAQCKSIIPCRFCNTMGHHTLLHYDRAISENQDRQISGESKQQKPEGRVLCTFEGPLDQGDVGSNNSGINKLDKNCSKTVLVDLFCDDSEIRLRTYAIIDDQSSVSLVDQRVLNYFGKTYPRRQYTLNFASDRFQVVEDGYLVSGMRVKAAGSRGKLINLPPMFSTRNMANTKHEVASPDEVASHHHISSLASNFPPLDHEAQVLLLIGRDCGEAMWCKSHSSCEPYAFETRLGWALVGKTVKHEKSNRRVLYTTVEARELLPSCSTFEGDPFALNLDDEEPGYSVEDRRFLQQMNDEVMITSEGSIQLPIPLKQGSKLPDNRLTVEYRTINTLRRLKSDGNRWLDCVRSMAECIDQQYVREVPENEISTTLPTWYLPIFPVYNKKGKTRLVFDASAKCKGTSLNDCLLQGPDLNNSLRGVLLRFREKQVGFMSDIAAMFNTFRLPKEQRELYRFFWPKNNEPEGKLVPYHSMVHLFGSRASPAIATFGLQYVAEQLGAPNSEDVRQFLRKNFYVDDGIGSADSPQKAIDIIKGTRRALAAYNINLHKIMSNREDVLQAFPAEDVATGVHTLECKDSPVTKTLGVVWNPGSDVFSINIEPPERPFTRRGVLSVVNSLYDPLGMISPVVLTGRLIMREVLPHKGSNKKLKALGWDDPLPEERQQEWKQWVDSLREIATLTIPRCFIREKPITQELHVFTDASQQAIGYVLYMRTVSECGIHVCMVAANSRVAPRAAVTVPRLELCAALEGTLAANRVVRELARPTEKIVYYSDSMITLGYIRNTSARYHQYVARRVGRILSATAAEQWFYVDTSINPADFASRPARPLELKSSTWCLGPPCLWEVNYQPGSAEPELLNSSLPEQKRVNTILKTSESSLVSILVELSKKLSSLNKLINVVTLLMRLGRSLDLARQRLGVLQAPRRSNFTRHEILTILIIHAQRDSNFCDILKLSRGSFLSDRSALAGLAPFLDDYGILRVGGRVRKADLPYHEKHPIFLASGHPFTLLVLRHYHEATYHQGRVITQAAIGQAGFYLQRSGRALRGLIAKCVTCRRLRGEALTQFMADLPGDRLANLPPFSNIGMDVFGPFMVYDGINSTRQRPSTKKVWALIFVCLVSRAVHLESLANMEAATFMNAYRRFQAVRGCVSVVRSDRGTNFISVRNRTEPTNIQDAVSELQRPVGNWILHPPLASHFAGSWERKIGSVRAVLNGALAALHRRNLSRDEFATYLAEASAIVNNTPLCETSTCPEDPSPITPAQLLTGKTSPNPPLLENFSAADLDQYGKTRWRRVQHLAEEFWRRWRKEYVSTLQDRQRWRVPRPSIKVGDIVLVREKNMPRNIWPLARVKAVRYSQDGRVRSVALTRPPLPGKEQLRVTTRCISDLTLLFSASEDDGSTGVNDSGVGVSPAVEDLSGEGTDG